MKKVYIADNYEARFELREIIEKYFKDFDVISRWIHHDYDDKTSPNRSIDAQMDVDDIMAADWFVLFTDPWKGKTGRGKWFEFGLAYALGKKIMLIGEEEKCVFVHLRKFIWKVKGIQEAVNILKGLLTRDRVDY